MVSNLLRIALLGFFVICVISTGYVPWGFAANLTGDTDVGSPNLVANGDFKFLSAPDRPLGWGMSLRGEPPYTVHVDEDVFDGRSALRLSGSNNLGYALLVMRNIPAVDYQNKMLKLSAWYKGEVIENLDSSTNYNFIRVEFYKNVDGSLTNSGNSLQIRAPGNTDDWTLLEREFEVPSETEQIWITIYFRDIHGQVQWTGVDLREVTWSGTSIDEQARSDQLDYSPHDGAVAYTNPPSFIWVPISGAVSYSLEYSTDPDFSPEATTTIEDVDISIYTPSELFEEGTVYYWRVRGVNLDGQMSAPSSTRGFHVVHGAPELLLPPLDEVRQRIPDGHPRLFVTPETLGVWRDKATHDILYRTLWMSIRTSAFTIGADFEMMPDEPPSPYANGAWDINLWRQYSVTVNAVNRMEVLAFAYMMTGDSTFGEAARKWMLHIASWNPAGATSAAANDESSRPILLKLSRAYTWAYDALSDDDRQLIQDVIRIRGTEAYNILKGRPYESRPYRSHDTGTLRYLGEASIAFLGDFPEAAEWFDYVIRLYYGVFPPWGSEAGGWAEGNAYWSNSINQHLHYVDALLAATGLNLYNKPFFMNTGNFKLYTHPPYSKIGPFGDFSDRPPNPNSGNVMAQLANIYQNPYYKWYSERMGTGIQTGLMGFIRAMIHPISQLRGKSPEDLPPSAYFFDIGWVAMHKKLGDAKDGIQFMFKSSPYGSFSHSFADQNTFTLEAYGTPLAISSGYRPWWGSEHHMRWTKTTQAHNGILVNGRGQMVESIDSKGRILSFINGAHFDYTAGDAVVAYNGIVDQYIRHVVYVRPDVFVVFDDIKAPKPSEFTWLLHGYHEMNIDESEGRISMDAQTARLDVRLWAPEALTYHQTNVFGTPLDEPMNVAEQWHLSATTTKDAEESYFLAVLTPDTAEKPKSVASQQLVLDAGVGVRIEDGTEATTILFRTNDGMLSADGLTVLGDVGAWARRNDDVHGILLVRGSEWENADGIRLISSVPVDAELTLAGDSFLEINGSVTPSCHERCDAFDMILELPGMKDVLNVESSETVLNWDVQGDHLRLRLPTGEHDLTIRVALFESIVTRKAISNESF